MATSEERVAANLRQIMRFEAKPYPKEQERTTVSRGFEKVAYPKIVRELKDPDLIIKQKSLLAAKDLLTPSEGLVQCITAGITPAIVALLQDPDDVVRERAARALVHLAAKELGCRDMAQHAGLSRLAVALEDRVVAVRDAAYDSLALAARHECTRRTLVSLKTSLPRVMELVQVEEGGRRLQGLRILLECAQVRHNADAVAQLVDRAGAVPHLADLLKPPEPPLAQELSARLLCVLMAAREDARLVAVSVGAVPSLVSLLDPTNTMLANAALDALAAVTIANEGKYAFIAAGGPAAVVPVLQCGVEVLVVGAMNVITNVAEAPEARPLLAQAGAQELLEAVLAANTSDLSNKSAVQAMRRCNFKHWPFEPLSSAT